MKKLKYILMLSVVGLMLGVACECGDSNPSVNAQTDGPAPMKVYENEYEDKWEFTHNGLKVKRLYDSYDAEYENNPNNSSVDRSHFDIYEVQKSGMKYMVIQNEYDDTAFNIINVTKDSLICAQLAGDRPVGVSSISPASTISETNKQEDWYKN